MNGFHGIATNDQMAEEALKICRGKLPNRSSNKKIKKNQLKEARRQQAEIEIGELRKAAGVVSIESYGALVSTAPAGNCMEYACLAATIG